MLLVSSTRAPVRIATVSAWEDTGVSRFRVRCRSTAVGAEELDRYVGTVEEAIALVKAFLEPRELSGESRTHDDDS